MKKINPKFSMLLLFIFGAASTRLFTEVGHSPLINMTPIGAMALFGGAYFNKNWKALFFPLLALFVSDLIINTYIYHGAYGYLYSGWFVIYGIFALMVFIGKFVIKKINVKNVVFATLIASLFHWIISDFAVWFVGIDITTGLPFTRDITGFVKCYTLALPYLQSFFLGTIIYSGLMFGLFELAKFKLPSLVLDEK